MDLSVSSEFAPILNGKDVYCGFSGGADSLTLLLLLSEVEEAFHFHLHAVHFEHGLRGRAGVDDADFCREFCKKQNIPFRCISLNVPDNMEPGEGIEAAARRLRMSHWKKISGKSIIALGHNADDLTENLFLRLMRGSNVSGLTSLSEYAVIDGVAIIRPLLGYSKNTIENFLQSRGLDWRKDASNDETEYGRNFLRNKILPDLYEKFPYGKDGISRSLKNLHSDALFIDDYAKDIYSNMDPSLRKNWINLQDAVLCRVFRLFLNEKTGKNVIAGHNFLTRFKSAVTNPPEQGYSQLIIPDLPDFSLYIGKNEIYFVDLRKKEEILWDPEKNKTCNCNDFFFEFTEKATEQGDGINSASFDRDLLHSSPLLIRQAQNGDKITAFGKKTPESIRKFLSESGIPAPLRSNYPVICDSSGEIIWIPGVKRSDKYPARDTDFLTILFRWKHF